MKPPAPGQKDIHALSDDAMVQKDILYYELSSRTRALERSKAENAHLQKQIEQLQQQLEKMQALLDTHALKLEK